MHDPNDEIVDVEHTHAGVVELEQSSGTHMRVEGIAAATKNEMVYRNLFASLPDASISVTHHSKPPQPTQTHLLI